MSLSVYLVLTEEHQVVSFLPNPRFQSLPAPLYIWYRVALGSLFSPQPKISVLASSSVYLVQSSIRQSLFSPKNPRFQPLPALLYVWYRVALGSLLSSQTTLDFSPCQLLCMSGTEQHQVVSCLPKQPISSALASSSVCLVQSSIRQSLFLPKQPKISTLASSSVHLVQRSIRQSLVSPNNPRFQPLPAPQYVWYTVALGVSFLPK